MTPNRKRLAVPTIIALLVTGASACTATRDTAAVMKDAHERSVAAQIRRAVGLPDVAANTQIMITDVSHHAGDPMIAILANRSAAGIWQVSYACAASYRCAEGANYRAQDYDLTPAQSTYVDIAIERLRRSPPESIPARTGLIAAHSNLSIRLPDLTLDVSNRGSVKNVVDDFRTALTAPLAR